jgi:uncharacterized membrane protein
MAVVLILCVSTLLFRALGAVGVEALASWPDAARWGLAVMLFFTAAAHFNKMRKDLVAMVPPSFPRPDLLVTATGVLEILGAIGILVPDTRRLAGLGLIALFVAMFAANVSAARRGLTLAGKPVTPLWLRLPMQMLFIAVAWWTTQPPGAAS